MDSCATVIYDGGCGICTKFARQILLWDTDGRVQLVSLWEYNLEARFPQLTREECLENLVAIESGGRLTRGADAVRTVVAHLGAPWRQLFVWPWLLPGATSLLRKGYRWFARHRHALGAGAACTATATE